MRSSTLPWTQPTPKKHFDVYIPLDTFSYTTQAIQRSEEEDPVIERLKLDLTNEVVLQDKSVLNINCFNLLYYRPQVQSFLKDSRTPYGSTLEQLVTISIMPNEANNKIEWVKCDSLITNQPLLSYAELGSMTAEMIARGYMSWEQDNAPKIQFEGVVFKRKDGTLWRTNRKHLILLERYAISRHFSYFPLTKYYEIMPYMKPYSKDTVIQMLIDIHKFALGFTPNFEKLTEAYSFNELGERTILTKVDSINNLYYFYSTPPRVYGRRLSNLIALWAAYGITDFTYHPDIGIVGGSYAKYFETFFGLKNTYFLPTTINGVPYEEYLRRVNQKK